MTEPDFFAPAITGETCQVAAEVWRIVAPNPSPLTGPGTNTYVIRNDSVVVIDPGPDDPLHLQRIVDAAGGTIERIVCTHSHPDHSPGAAPLSKFTGAPVLGRPAPTVDYQDPTYAPHVVVFDDDRIAAGSATLRVLHTPGHASNHICLLLERERLLFTGDHLMQGSTVVILPPDGSMKTYLDSLERLKTLDIETIAPGHGHLIPDAHGEMTRVIAHRMKREAKLVAVLSRRRTATLDELLPDVYDDVPVSLHGWARHSLLAHALKLVDDGRVRLDEERYRWLDA